MSIRIETPESNEALTEFVLFYDQVYEYRTARWPANLMLDLANITGQTPFAKDREMRPFVARDGDRIVARALAVVDARYIRHWKERLGYLAMFDALPGTEDATAQLVKAACEWLQAQGVEAARAGGTHSAFDTPFAIDNYDELPNSFDWRQNPPYYHVLLKNAGFESEKGWVDYHIEVRPELLDRWRSAIEEARRSGYEMVLLKDVPESRRVSMFTFLLNDTFKNHWGFAPSTEEEFALILPAQAPGGVLDTTVIAYRNGEPMGLAWVVPSDTSTAVLKPGRELHDSEKMNFLVIGVREAARRGGVAMAMASCAYLELVRRGATYVCYGLVLDDNWASRHTAEKLGGIVRGNRMSYRRNFFTAGRAK